MQDQNKEGLPPMSLARLVALIREHRRRSAQQAYEEGAQIKRRLQELRAVPTPAQLETRSTNPCENGPTGYRDGHLHWS